MSQGHLAGLAITAVMASPVNRHSASDAQAYIRVRNQKLQNPSALDARNVRAGAPAADASARTATPATLQRYGRPRGTRRPSVSARNASSLTGETAGPRPSSAGIAGPTAQPAASQRARGTQSTPSARGAGLRARFARPAESTRPTRTGASAGAALPVMALTPPRPGTGSTTSRPAGSPPGWLPRAESARSAASPRPRSASAAARPTR